MDSAELSGKNRLACKFSKVLHIRSVITGIAPDDEFHKIMSENVKNNISKNPHLLQPFDEKQRNKTAETDAFLAKIFANISSVKAAYAQLQFAQSAYDSNGIQFADEIVVSELRNLSELKQCFMKQQLDISFPETTLLLAEVQENQCLLKTYVIIRRNLDSEVKLKESEITFLKEKLEETKLLEKRLKFSGQLPVLNNFSLSSLRPCHFIIYLRQAIKSIRSFVRLLISEMESADWDFDSAINSIEPGVVFWKSSHKCYAFESFVSRVMFDGFNHPEFSPSSESSSDTEFKNRQQVFFDRFIELKSVKPMDYLAWKPKSRFSRFCRAKYLKLVHPKMESSLFGNLDQRNLINAAGVLFPETSFFVAFVEMTKRIWLLHCLAFTFKPEAASIFQVTKRSRFSEVYMESVCDEPFLTSNGSHDIEPRVAFTVIPGFRIGKTAVQCQVYLR